MNADPTWPVKRWTTSGMAIDYSKVRACGTILGRDVDGSQLWIPVRLKKESQSGRWSLDVTSSRGEYILPEDVYAVEQYHDHDSADAIARTTAEEEGCCHLPVTLEYVGAQIVYASPEVAP